MSEFREIFQILNQSWDFMEIPDHIEKVFSLDEDCPYGDAVFSSIKKGVTIYREETIHTEMPDEVHIRLHKTIRRQWEFQYPGDED